MVLNLAIHGLNYLNLVWYSALIWGGLIPLDLFGQRVNSMRLRASMGCTRCLLEPLVLEPTGRTGREVSIFGQPPQSQMSRSPKLPRYCRPSLPYL